MSEPCPLCGREKLKDRVRRRPPMTPGDEEGLCLHPAHIYDRELPPCEARGVARIAELRATAERARAEGIDDAVAWMREHLTGISAPNDGDFEEMRRWIADRR
jgi:hypothetical protein